MTNYSRSEAVQKLSKLIGRSKSRDFVDSLYDETSKIRKRKYSSHKDSQQHSETRRHESVKVVRQKDVISSKIHDNIEDIEEKKKKKEIETNVPNKYITEASEKAKQVNFLHSKIQESLAKHGLVNQPVSDVSTSLVDPNATKITVKLNQAGQTVDAITGAPVTLVQYTPTAKINVRVKRKQLAQSISSELKKTVLKPVEKKEEIPVVNTKHFDARVEQQPKNRDLRGLKFHEPGKFSHMAQTQRTKLQLEKLQDKIQSTAKRTGIASATKLAMVTLKHEAETSGKTPDIEWWDTSILPTRSYAAFEEIRSKILLNKLDSDSSARLLLQDSLAGITNLIEHPVPRLPPGEARDSSASQIFLTKFEQKKIRTLRRRQNEKEKQEKIILGLMPPPPPKVKMSNLMRVLGTEAVQDPTKVETYVKQQIAARQNAHEQANATRKLTPAQKKTKLIKKYKEDTSLAVHTAVYRIWDISNRSNRFKVDKNAQQNYMTGCVLLFQDMNLVILEGGPKSQKRMKRLLLQRINWSKDIISSSNINKSHIKTIDEEKEAIHNKCSLVWEGAYGYPSFKEWNFKQFDSEAVAREFLKKHRADHYWDLAYSLSISEENN
ncbi:hypothetical protein HZS_4512 [Henneguya salminicola]|nr:hypothetical protein HZS_4512 [Henneguya salminicola]